MIESCKRGPPGARVTDVKVEWEEYRGKFNRFSIRH
jgi:acylphosphatase